MTPRIRITIKRAGSIFCGLILALALVFLLIGETFLRVEREPINGKVDAVVVLAGGHPEDKHRIEKGLALIRRGKAGVLILPLRHPAFRWSWAVDFYGLPSDASAVSVLIGRSTPAEAQWLDDYGGTYTEARKTKEIMRRHRLHSAIVVSSAYHMRRAAMAFSRFENESALQFFYQSVDPARSRSAPWWMNGDYVIKLLKEYRKVAAAYLVYRR
jgi:uncharacterized SAM-binding protein YcdF (DUF218 family)